MSPRPSMPGAEPPRQIRVVIVDDAVVVRRLLTEALNSDPEVTVVGAGANGRLGLAKIDELQPDLVVLDIEMPEMDGIATLRELRKRYRWLPVIMFSTLTERGAAATLEALSAGASDYVTKPTNTGGIQGSIGRISAELLPKVKQLARRYQSRPSAGSVAANSASRPAAATRTNGRSETPRATSPSASTPAARVNRRGATPSSFTPRTADPIALAAPRVGGRYEALTIGVSTGGPNALAELLPQLPESLHVPVLVVQHMPPIFTRLLAERLDRLCKLTVVEATEGMAVKPGHVYIAPGDLHMGLRRAGTAVAIALSSAPPENSCRPSVDVLFRSVVETYGAAVLSVVLTGMGQDGLAGARVVHGAGGCVLTQDEETSVVWGMPGYVARAGVAEAVLPLSRVMPEIMTRLNRSAAPVAAGRPR